MKSVIQEEKKCFICGSYMNLESHHIFGASNRKLSERYGLKVWLCHTCHNEPPAGVHHNVHAMDFLHRVGQQAFEHFYPEEDFKELFGRSYL